MRIEYNESPQWVRKIEFCCQGVFEATHIENEPALEFTIGRVYTSPCWQPDGFGLYVNGKYVRYCMFCGAEVEVVKVVYEKQTDK
jgi:hypothetical protein